MLDLYTLVKEKGHVDGLTVALAGDLKNGRTVHSLATLLANFGVKFYLVSPAALAMPPDIVSQLAGAGCEMVADQRPGRGSSPTATCST